MNGEVEKITKENRILTCLKKSYLLKSVRRRRLHTLGVASLALKSEPNLEFHHLHWLGVRGNRLERGPRKEMEPSKIQLT